MRRSEPRLVRRVVQGEHDPSNPAPVATQTEVASADGLPVPLPQAFAVAVRGEFGDFVAAPVVLREDLPAVTAMHKIGAGGDPDLGVSLGMSEVLALVANNTAEEFDSVDDGGLGHDRLHSSRSSVRLAMLPSARMSP